MRLSFIVAVIAIVAITAFLVFTLQPTSKEMHTSGDFPPFVPRETKIPEVPKIPEISTISNFSVIQDGPLYKVMFSLVDENTAYVSSDGHIKFMISEKGGEELYHQEFDVKAKQFKMGKVESFGDMYLGYYTWSFDASAVKTKDDELSAHMEFILPDGKILKASKDFRLR